MYWPACMEPEWMRYRGKGVHEGFEPKYQNFEKDTLTNRQPLEIHEDWGDMVVFAGLQDKFGSSILDSLQLVNAAI